MRKEENKRMIANPILRNILAIVLGWVVGSAINMGLINYGYTVFPIEGLDPNDMEALKAAIPSFKPINFIFPFLAHALGTLIGAVVAGFIAPKYKMNFALTIGVLFLIGGIMVNYMLPGPITFIVTDLVMAYIPMAWIGGLIVLKLSN